ncbi:hypothetical protein PGTUg99_032326 [Puccinia graminis f. sp. tritici]|uniref:Uncharacterized protein n=1 Tax=Puccinia graminis f. sp. tritici TaxID=56615 RepID=A0A5B0N1K1_PUCGR|nr:hypothetical protein PGTUg99_032326 [Puccinia graminis f. sp. tritici]
MSEKSRMLSQKVCKDGSHHLQSRTNFAYPVSFRIIFLSWFTMLMLEIAPAEAMQTALGAGRTVRFSSVGKGMSLEALENGSGLPTKLMDGGQVNQARGDQNMLSKTHIETPGLPPKLENPTALLKATEPVNGGQHVTVKTVPIAKDHLAQLVTHYGDRVQTKDFVKNDKYNVYRALAHFKYRDQEKYGLVAKEIKKYIRNNPSQFKNYRIGIFSMISRKYAADESIRIGFRWYRAVGKEGNAGVIFSSFTKSQPESSSLTVISKTPGFQGDSVEFKLGH